MLSYYLSRMWKSNPSKNNFVRRISKQAHEVNKEKETKLGQAILSGTLCRSPSIYDRVYLVRAVGTYGLLKTLIFLANLMSYRE